MQVELLLKGGTIVTQDRRQPSAHVRFGHFALERELVVLTPNPFELPPEAVAQSRVVLTMAGGRITFEGG